MKLTDFGLSFIFEKSYPFGKKMQGRPRPHHGLPVTVSGSEIGNSGGYRF